VSRLHLFGSATREDFNPSRSDLDFLVEFNHMAPAQYVGCYFGLSDDLENLLGLKVDLVEAKAITNPYFLQSVEETRVVLYDAA